MANLLYLHVAQAMEREIRKGDLPFGTKLPSERILAAKHHVSRNVVRQALSQLAQQGLIEQSPGKGAVIRYTCDEKVIETIRQMLLAQKASFLDALEVREVLETAIIQKCIPYITEERLAELYNIWEQMEFHMKHQQMEHFLQQDALFHETIAKFIPNPMFHLLLQTVYSMPPQDFFNLSRTLETAQRDTQTEHLMILEGLKNRDVEQACRALRVQLENIRQDLMRLSQSGG